MRYGLIGYTGRMGREISELFERNGHELVMSVDERIERATGVPEAIVDFSLPPALPVTLRLCREHGAALVIGTTGFNEAEIADIRALAAEVPVVHSSNFCIGINLMAMILSDYTDRLADWELEIEELHHNKKRDAPSGTALMLMAATGRTCPTHSLRLGNVPGDHSVYFGNGDEIMQFSHRIVNRSALSQGALKAAEFAATAEPGYYNFQDVLRAKAK